MFGENRVNVIVIASEARQSQPQRALNIKIAALRFARNDSSDWSVGVYASFVLNNLRDTANDSNR
ncbi:MAG: hypothetical protein COB33_004400 [Thiotrichaceae bacterium]|nr:hypothetical protein [Thiotrichaceae bacterium]